jgi:hypothetical protein
VGQRHDESSLSNGSALGLPAHISQWGFQSRVLSEMPFFDAIIVTAPTVRFNDFEIFATPAFCFANPFSIRKSVAVHGRMVRAFFAISSPLVTQWARVLPDQCCRSRIDISSDANAKLPRRVNSNIAFSV